MALLNLLATLPAVPIGLLPTNDRLATKKPGRGAGAASWTSRLVASKRLRAAARGRPGGGPLRRHPRPGRGVVHRRAARNLRADRAERVGQDHAVQLHQRHLSPRRGRYPLRGPVDRRAAAPPPRGAGDRSHLPEPRFVPQHERARQHPDRRASFGTLRVCRQCAAPARGAGRGSHAGAADCPGEGLGGQSVFAVRNGIVGQPDPRRRHAPHGLRRTVHEFRNAPRRAFPLPGPARAAGRQGGPGACRADARADLGSGHSGGGNW